MNKWIIVLETQPPNCYKDAWGLVWIYSGHTGHYSDRGMKLRIQLLMINYILCIIQSVFTDQKMPNIYKI